MNTKLVGYAVSLVGFMFIMSVAGADSGKIMTPAGRVSAAVAKAEVYVKQVLDARDIGMMADKNAIAVRNEAEQDVLNAMKKGNKRKIKRAKKCLRQANKGAKNARDMLEALMEHVTDCLATAASVRERAKIAAGLKDGKDLKLTARKVERLVESMAKYAGKAQALAEQLKEKWLVSALGVATTTTTTTTTTQPPTPTPIGRR
ncbi:MAG: hypothetical protein KAH23_01845 [Kiritimatiellae bacterium]|nr:hypothetical protein [Kiritimatiellia bacterium]